MSFNRSLRSFAGNSDFVFGGGIFKAIVVIDGQVVGTWTRAFKKGSVAISLTPFARLTQPQWRAVAAAAERYGKFVGMSAEVHATK